MTSNIKRKVYIPNLASHDFSAAEKYGELVFVTKGHQNRYSIDDKTRAWARALKGSNPEDCIVVSSYSHLVAVGCAMFAVKHGRLNLLLYQDNKYILREALLRQALEAEEANE